MIIIYITWGFEIETFMTKRIPIVYVSINSFHHYVKHWDQRKPKSVIELSCPKATKNNNPSAFRDRKDVHRCPGTYAEKGSIYFLLKKVIKKDSIHDKLKSNRDTFCNLLAPPLQC